MRQPNVFIVGAPKCGTTALDSYLKSHPEVFFRREKDLHFFGSDLEFRVPRVRMEKYLSYFKAAGNAKVVGESSVWYMFSRNAAREIYDFNREAKVLIMVRNPVDMLYSLHSQLLFTRDEDISDFEEALAAEQQRRQGRMLPEGANVKFGVYYRDVARFSEQIQRYLDRFGRERVYIGTIDELKENPHALLQSIFDFLEVDASFVPLFEKVNANKRTRSAWLNGMLQEVGVQLKRGGSLPVPPILKGGMYSALKLAKRLNTSVEPREPLAVNLRASLREEFREEIDRLSVLIQKDLSGWLA